MAKNFSNEKVKEKAFLFGVIFDNKEDVFSQLKELERLCVQLELKLLEKIIKC